MVNGIKLPNGRIIKKVTAEDLTVVLSRNKEKGVVSMNYVEHLFFF